MPSVQAVLCALIVSNGSTSKTQRQSQQQPACDLTWPNAYQDDQLSTQDALIERKEDRIKQLEKLLVDFKRALFGARSEKLNPEQYELALEDIETTMAIIHAEDEAIDPAKSKSVPRKSNRDHLPKHLPRVEEIIEPESITCACGAERHIIHCPAAVCKQTMRGAKAPPSG